MGGYVAGCTLRAAGACSNRLRPVALSSHYLSVAVPAVEISSRPEARAKCHVSHRAEVSQADQRDSRCDGVEPWPRWRASNTMRRRHPTSRDRGTLALAEDGARPYPFWDISRRGRFTTKRSWPPAGPRPATWQSWLRFSIVVDLSRSLGRCRTLGDPGRPAELPSAHAASRLRQPPFSAPTLDLNVAFHQPAEAQPWLLCDGTAPLSQGVCSDGRHECGLGREAARLGGGQCTTGGSSGDLAGPSDTVVA